MRAAAIRATPYSRSYSASPRSTDPPVAVPMLGSAPTVSSTPVAGQGIALDTAGKLTVKAQFLGVLTADPIVPQVGQFWYRSDTSQLCVRHDSSTTKRVTLT